MYEKARIRKENRYSNRKCNTEQIGQHNECLRHTEKDNYYRNAKTEKGRMEKSIEGNFSRCGSVDFGFVLVGYIKSRYEKLSRVGDFA